MKKIIKCFATCLMFASATSFAQPLEFDDNQIQALFDYHCMTCHAINEQRVSIGPSLARISEDFAGGSDDDVDYLAAVIRHGSEARRWGRIPMPPSGMPAEMAEAIAYMMVYGEQIAVESGDE